MDSIVLIGYMGCGKSSVAAALAKLSGLPVLDADETIAARMGMSITSIFEKYGEERFRSEETALLNRLCDGAYSGILSAGGGMPLREENRRLMKKLGKVVWLTASPATIAERLKNDHSRPLLSGAATAEEKEARIRDMLRKREGSYAAAADLALATDELSISAIAEHILKA
ncbi:MAG: shikimate kinase [Lachnospiraceae bacterium]|nr:shikimate kinase [Lachnospiraceae bacterium]